MRNLFSPLSSKNVQKYTHIYDFIKAKYDPHNITKFFKYSYYIQCHVNQCQLFVVKTKSEENRTIRASSQLVTKMPNRVHDHIS